MILLRFDSVILFLSDERSETALDPISVFIRPSRRRCSFVIGFASFSHAIRNRQFLSSVRIDFLALPDAVDTAAFIHAIPGGAFPGRRFADGLPGRVSGVAGGQARLARTGVGAVGNDDVHRAGVHCVHRVGVCSVCSWSTEWLNAGHPRRAIAGSSLAFVEAKHFRTSPYVIVAMAGVAIVFCNLCITINACR